MLNSSSEKHKLRRQDEKVIRPILKLIPISEHSQLETKKREYWIRTITKEAPKALRCTHVQGGSPNRRIYGSTYEVKVALNGYGWTLKIPSRSDHTLQWYATLCTPPKRRGASMQGGHHLHTCTTSTSQGVSYGETSQTLNAQKAN